MWFALNPPAIGCILPVPIKLHRFRLPVSQAYLILLVLIARGNLQNWFWSTPLVALGILWRLWASGVIHKSRAIAKTGPYALMRHPLYFGSFLIGLGFTSSALPHPLYLILYFALFFAFYFPLMVEEEKKLRDAFPEEYPKYQAQVPRFLPNFRNSKDLCTGFSWKTVHENREWRGLLMILV
ncbi:MAG: methyltransferase family protein, partial [bacterium]